MPSPFQTIAGAAEGKDMEATPVHHEDIQGPLQDQVASHEAALKGYMGRIANGETLHPDEYHDYESRMKEHSHDSMLLEKLNKQHGILKNRGNTLMRKGRQSITREKGSELLKEYGEGQ